MERIKKLIAFLLVSVMATSMLACGQKEEVASSAEWAGKEAVETSAEDGGDETAAAQDTVADEHTAASQPITIRIGVPKAPPTLAVLHIMEDGLLGENVTVKLDVWDAPEQLLAMVQDGEHDLFAFPLTVAAKLYNKGVPVVLTNVNTWGVTYFMTTDPDFQDWSQLKGKTVYIPLQSSPPDALTQYFMDQAGLKAGEDVEIVYVSTSEAAQLLASGEAEYATLIEPQCTAAMVQNEQVRVAFSFEEEWQKIKGNEGTRIPNAGFGTTQNLIDNHPELVAAFESAYEESLDWVLAHPSEAAALAEKHLGLKSAVVEKAVPRMGLHYKAAADAKPELDSFYQLLNDFDATMIGGEIPDEGMYFSK